MLFLASCAEFGASGSGIVRKWRVDPKESTDTLLDDDQYALVGPLTMSKGCDNAFIIPEFVYRGFNAAIVTDAICYMDWIAAQYGMKIPQELEKKESCSQSKGDRRDFNKPVCRTSFGTYCNFSAVFEESLWDSCRLLTWEGIAYNINICIENGNTRNGN